MSRRLNLYPTIMLKNLYPFHTADDTARELRRSSPIFQYPEVDDLAATFAQSFLAGPPPGSVG